MLKPGFGCASDTLGVHEENRNSLAVFDFSAVAAQEESAKSAAATVG
jgi:hypothetical protein